MPVSFFDINRFVKSMKYFKLFFEDECFSGLSTPDEQVTHHGTDLISEYVKLTEMNGSRHTGSST